jgi:hypothetical protein
MESCASLVSFWSSFVAFTRHDELILFCGETSELKTMSGMTEFFLSDVLRGGNLEVVTSSKLYTIKVRNQIRLRFHFYSILNKLIKGPNKLSNTFDRGQLHPLGHVWEQSF